MPKYTFSLPNGKKFELTGPAGSTAAEAEKIFLEQLAAGAFVGLQSGDTLTSPETQIQQFELSRLDRGTAGQVDVPLLSITSGGVISALPPLANVQVENGITTSDFATQARVTQPVGPLSPTQVQSLVAAAAKAANQASDVVSNEGIGKYKLTAPQLEETGYIKPGTSCRFMGTGNNTKYRESAPNFQDVVNSPSVWTGKNGITEIDKLLENVTLQDKIQETLVRQSYNQFVSNGEISVPNSTQPVALQGTVISAKNNDNNNLLASVLSGGLLATAGGGLFSALNGGGGFSQKISQFNVSSIISGTGNAIGGALNSVSKLASGSLASLSGSLTSVTSINGITESISNLANSGIASLGGLLNSASAVGISTATSWAKGLSADGLTSQLNQLGKQGQFAINFSDFKLTGLVAGTTPAAGYTGTINRDTVNLATAKLIGSNKIPTPTFGIPSTSALSFDSLQGPMNNASSILKGGTNTLLGQASGITGATAITAGTSSSTSSASNSAARQAAIADVEKKQQIYEVAKAEYGISSSQAQEAFSAYKLALANLDNFA